MVVDMVVEYIKINFQKSRNIVYGTVKIYSTLKINVELGRKSGLNLKQEAHGP